MSTDLGSGRGAVAVQVAARHERDVLAVLRRLREERRLVEAVIDAAFEITLQRGETTPDARSDFTTWSQSVVTSARSTKVVDSLATGWSKELVAVLDRYLAIAGSADTTAASVAQHVAEVDDRLGQSLDSVERHVAHLVAGVLVGSVTMWADDRNTAKKAGGGIDKSQVARADVMGAITGAAGAAAATWWTGPVGAGAATGAAATGAALGSAVDIVMQDAANDALDQGAPE